MQSSNSSKPSLGILGHYKAGTGAVLVETREEASFLEKLLQELPEKAAVHTIAAPGGPILRAKNGQAIGSDEVGLLKGYTWATGGAGRVLVVYDFHMLVNNPGHWRALSEALPNLRSPKGAGKDDPASLVVYVSPTWHLDPNNPLRGTLPVIPFHPPARDVIKQMAESLAPLGKKAEQIADALCGLTAQAAEQAAAECLAANEGKWNVPHLQRARKQLLREAGLEIWEPTEDVGGLSGIREFCEAELFPWVLDDQLSVRRLLMAGVPGVGKSYISRWIAHRLGCLVCRLSMPSLKAGLVGQSEANLKRAFRTIDALGAEASMVVVLDEVDTIAREGLDGGTSSGMFAELLTWLQESKSRAIVVATLNRLDKLDAALESRFQARFFFDLPSQSERESVAKIHFARLGCERPDEAGEALAKRTEGFSSREIAEQICPSAARRSGRKPDTDILDSVLAGYTPASKNQSEQLDAMRKAAGSLRRANDPIHNDEERPKGRRVSR